MYEYQCLREYSETMAEKLTWLSREGWELVGQPMPGNSSIFCATVRREVVKH